VCQLNKENVKVILNVLMTELALICNVLTHVENTILVPKMLFAWLKAIEQFANVQVVGLVILMLGVSNMNVK
jgi:hypothetical protein